MLIKISNENISNCKIFRFEYYWLEHANVIFNIWNALIFKVHSNPMHAFYHILARVRRNVCSIKQYGMGAFDSKVKNIEVQLQALEASDSNNSCIDFDSFRSLQNKYRALLRQNHSRLAQRSRLNWITSGDMKFALFHRSIRIRRHHNFISSILDNNGGRYNDNWQIETVFLDHFLIFRRTLILDLLILFWRLSPMIFPSSLMLKRLL